MKTILAIILFLAGAPALADQWSVVLVAGSPEQHVFDNAMESMQKRLDLAGADSRRFTSDYAVAGLQSGRHIPFATTEGIRDSLTRASGPCFLYLTSHGDRSGQIAVGREALSVQLLGEILQESCGQKPGVLIISACFSGQYMELRHKLKNWTIMTASSPDRSSFGCTNDITYTYWDGCLLEGLDLGIKDLKPLHMYVARCARALEHKLKLQPGQYSIPMFYQGKDSPKRLPL